MSDPTTNVPPEQRSYSPAASISNQMVRLFAQYFGRGPTKARTTLNTNIAVVLMGEVMTRAEENLVAAGEAKNVRALRRTLQGSMRLEAVAAVEQIVGREITAYMADVDTEANMAVVAFVFTPQVETGAVEVAEAE